MAKKPHRLLELFLTFFKIGLFTFGGGYAMIALIEDEVSTKKKWISKEELADVITIAESTPGPIAINSATFVGYRVCGFWGSFAATCGVVLPSFILILAITSVLDAFQSIKAVQYAFWGIRAGVLALIFKALVGMYKKCPKSILSYIVMAAALLLVTFFNVDSILVIIGCGIAGLITSIVAARRAGK